MSINKTYRIENDLIKLLNKEKQESGRNKDFTVNSAVRLYLLNPKNKQKKNIGKAERIRGVNRLTPRNYWMEQDVLDLMEKFKLSDGINYSKTINNALKIYFNED